MRATAAAKFITIGLLASGSSLGASVEFFVNAAGDYDYGLQTTLPPGFGVGEFTFELWVKLNENFQPGNTGGGGVAQRENWSSADPAPYSSQDWWFRGNFLLDGHNNSAWQRGTFDLQVVGGGRIRWLFGDGTAAEQKVGSLWAVQRHPSNMTPSLLDGQWHQITCVRRFPSGASSADLELWIDGVLIATETTPARTNMAADFWNNWSGGFPQPGWYWTAEKQVVTSGQFEDYKGLIDEMRFWSRAKTASEIMSGYATPVTGTEPGLVGRYAFSEASGTNACDTLAPTRCIQLINMKSGFWTAADAPLTGTADTSAPTVPANLQGSAASATQINLSWNASTDNVGVHHYRVLRNGAVVGIPTGTTFNDTGLSPSTQYIYTVSAVDAAGNRSAESVSRTVSTPGVTDGQPPTVPTNLQGTAVSSTRIDLTWTASTDNVGVTGYRVTRNGTVVSNPAGTSFSDTGLAPNTSYTYTVSAVDAAGNRSAESAARSVTTPVSTDVQAPTTPTNLQGTAASSSRIDLTWTASTDNVGVTGYRVSRNGTVVGTPSAASFSDSGLVANTNYVYTVAAIDAAGNESSPSGSVSINTPPAAATSDSGGGGSVGGVLLFLLAGLAARRARKLPTRPAVNCFAPSSAAGGFPPTI